MLSIKFIRENLEKVKKATLEKGVNLDLDKLLSMDGERRRLIGQIEQYKSERNRANEKMKKLALDSEERRIIIERGKVLKDAIAKTESGLSVLEKDYKELMVNVPNIISSDTPEGVSEKDNVEIFRSAKIPVFDFKPKDHIQLGKELDIIDLERGAKVGGYRGYYIKNEGVSLMMGFLMYAVAKMVSKGYLPMLVPTIVKEFSLFGSGYFKGSEYNQAVDEIYQVASFDRDSDGKIGKERKFLVGTAEPSLLAYYANDVLREEQLPIRTCGYSQCYRSEIGSYGKDTKGMYRVHEFMKVEQVVILRADVEESVNLQDEMVGISKEMHEELGLPYHQIQICSGDMGLGKYRMFDIETWLPGLDRWGETGSASNFLDWQARRLNVRYETLGGKREYVFMLNNTALPSPRIFIAILENYQQKDGSVVIPEVVKPYMPVKCDIITRK